MISWLFLLPKDFGDPNYKEIIAKWFNPKPEYTSFGRPENQLKYG
jgi:hypothetical protein